MQKQFFNAKTLDINAKTIHECKKKMNAKITMNAKNFFNAKLSF